jgi:hypothetical protein
MAKAREGMRQLSCWVREDTLGRIEELAGELGRGVAVEVQHALERHLASRPRLEVPAQPEAVVPPPAKPRGAKPGRKRPPKG